MTISSTSTSVASTESSNLVYMLRRAALLVVFIAAIGAVVATATGRLDGVLGRGGETVGAAAEAFSSVDEPATRTVAPLATGAVQNTDEAPAAVAPPIDEDANTEPVEAPVSIAPSRASRLVAQTPDRVLDTRSESGSDGDLSPPSPDAIHPITVPDGYTAVALSVSLLSAERSGSVTVDGSAGLVEAVAVGGAGASVTNLVIVPIVGTELTVRSSAGGHLVVDLVGWFEAAPEGSNDGRFVAIDPTRITELETAVDGREATLTVQQAVPQDGVSAMLAVIVADVGADGGVVQLGPASGAFDQMLMWGPADENSRQRRGLALIQPGDDGKSALLYNGGSALTVDVIGYFTDETAAVTVDGLYVPSGPRLLFSGQLGPEVPAVLTGVEPESGIGVATVASRSTDAGRLWSVAVPVDRGAIQVSASTETEADVTLLGVFIG